MGTADVEDLLPLALSHPDKALAMAHLVLRSTTKPGPRSVAHQAAGIVHRDAGRTSVAIGHVREALRLARRTGDPARVGDVQATFGVLLVATGRTRAGLERLHEAIPLVSGVDRARVRLRLAHALLRLGRPREALAHLEPALATTRRAGDVVWQARCLEHRGWARAALGSFAASDADAAAADALFTRAGQHFEAGWAVGNRADLALARGDLPVALTLLDEAERRFAAGGSVLPDAEETRCRVLLIAGLAPEALDRATAAAARADLAPVLRAEFLLVAAAAALALDRADEAAELATDARALFARQDRASWTTRADLVRFQARVAAGRITRSEFNRAVRLAQRLGAERSPEAPLALLLAGRLALQLGRPGLAAEPLRVAARTRHTGSSLQRATGWLAAALGYAAAGETAGYGTRADAASTNSTSSGRPSATPNCGPWSPRTGGSCPPWLWAAPWTAGRPASCCGGASAGAPRHSPRRRSARPRTPSSAPRWPGLGRPLAGWPTPAPIPPISREPPDRQHHEAGVRRRYRQLAGSGPGAGRCRSRVFSTPSARTLSSASWTSPAVCMPSSPTVAG